MGILYLCKTFSDMTYGGNSKMRYIKPEIEINEIQSEDVITLSISNILNWGNLTDDQKENINITEDESGNPSIDVGADFFG